LGQWPWGPRIFRRPKPYKILIGFSTTHSAKLGVNIFIPELDGTSPKNLKVSIKIFLI